MSAPTDATAGDDPVVDPAVDSKIVAAFEDYRRGASPPEKLANVLTGIAEESTRPARVAGLREAQAVERRDLDAVRAALAESPRFPWSPDALRVVTSLLLVHERQLSRGVVVFQELIDELSPPEDPA